MDEKKQIEPQDHWDDQDFLNEMQARVDDYESGQEKGISWEEFNAKIRIGRKAFRQIIKYCCRCEVSSNILLEHLTRVHSF